MYRLDEEHFSQMMAQLSREAIGKRADFLKNVVAIASTMFGVITTIKLALNQPHRFSILLLLSTVLLLSCVLFGLNALRGYVLLFDRQYRFYREYRQQILWGYAPTRNDLFELEYVYVCSENACYICFVGSLLFLLVFSFL